MARKTVTIINNQTGQQEEFPLLEGSHGPPVVDIRSLYGKMGLFTYDPGYKSTASCSSNITFIDGEKGILLYRGYPIEELAQKSCYLEVCYLLLYGDLPDREAYAKFHRTITTHSMVNEGLRAFMSGFRYDAHPMSILVGVVGALSSFYHHDLDVNDAEHQQISAHRLIAKLPTIAAAAYKYSIGQPFVYPRNDLCYSENFLHMMFSVPAETYQVDPLHAQTLDMLFLLHADHEQNASTSTVRLAGSSFANPFAAVSAGIGALWGPAHGGANEAVIRMIEEIGDPKNIPAYVERAKDRNDPFRLNGFGHRVYKNYDPRARILRKACHQVFEKAQVSDPFFDIALRLEEIAMKDEYFLEKKLYPNVDFYSGIIYRQLGIPVDMFTVLFAVARCIGWIAQWKEMISDPERVIGRPRQLYTGPRSRDYLDPDQRGYPAGSRKHCPRCPRSNWSRVADLPQGPT